MPRPYEPTFRRLREAQRAVRRFERELRKARRRLAQAYKLNHRY